MVAPKAVQRLPRAVAAAARQTAATSAVWLRHRVACAATLLTLFLWLGLLHTNAAVALLALLFLPSPAAVAALAGLLVLGLLPVRRPFRRWQRRLAHHICLVAHAYFPISLACSPAAEAAFASGGLFVVGLEPHSVLPVGLVAFHPGAPGLPPSLDGLKRAALASSTLFRVPLVKHMWSWLGLQAVDRRNCRRLLHSGHSLVLVPGGVRECLHLAHGTETVFLRKRFGFVKLSIQHGASLVPAFAFGQSRCFGFYKPKVRGWAADVLSRWAGCAPILFWGRLGSPIPYPVPLRIFVGDPIPTRRCTEPSDAEVAALLGQFVAAMQELFEKHKAEAGYPDLKLCVL